MIDITKEKLLELISSGESEHIEFKESFNDEAIEVLAHLLMQRKRSTKDAPGTFH